MQLLCNRLLPSYKQYGEFYSIKTKAKDNLCVSQYRWFVSLMYVSPDSEWIRHIRNMFCFNWTHYLYPVDYLLIDYLFEYEQSHNSILSTLIANNPYNNEDVLSLQKNFNESLIQTNGIYGLIQQIILNLLIKAN